jgi:hypothetical protein
VAIQQREKDQLKEKKGRKDKIKKGRKKWQEDRKKYAGRRMNEKKKHKNHVD